MVIASNSLDRGRALDVLSEVSDPEIPAISIVDLGIVESIEIEGPSSVHICCLPTFVGCPALDVIKEDIVAAFQRHGISAVVDFVFDPPWTSDRITEQGRRHLLEFGLAPPGRSQNLDVPLTLISAGSCPYCRSSDTVVESPFGPTSCRAICYCRTCRNPYEKFKEL